LEVFSKGKIPGKDGKVLEGHKNYMMEECFQRVGPYQKDDQDNQGGKNE